MSSIEENTDEMMRKIADHVKSKCGAGYGFAVLVFPFGAAGQTAHYISNANRADMINVLRKKADVLEKQICLDIEEQIKDLGEEYAELDKDFKESQDLKNTIHYLEEFTRIESEADGLKREKMLFGCGKFSIN